MYLVVSRWKAKPGKEAAFDAVGVKMRALLLSQPGATLVEAFRSGDTKIVVHGYADEAAYNRVVNDENGAFARAAKENELESVAQWLGSDRGESEPHA